MLRFADTKRYHKSESMLALCRINDSEAQARKADPLKTAQGDPNPEAATVVKAERPEGVRKARGANAAGDDDGLREAMITAAGRLLAASPDQDIATRAVSEAVGVTQPVLYRLFGDKNGLLDAVADAGFESYARQKAELERTSDPVADLRAGWDDHLDFARRNPALYQLMFAPRPLSNATAHRRILELLQATLVRCAAVGALTIEPRPAAQLILSANMGIALNRIIHPDLFDDVQLSHRAREAVFGAVLTEAAPITERDPVRAAALQLHSQLALAGTEALEPVERALLERWLERIVRPGE